MTRLTDKEKLMLSQAKEHTALPSGLEINSVGTVFKSMFQSIRRPFLRAAIVHRLDRLDDRILDDIGIARWEIPAVADRVAGRSAQRLSTAVARMASALAGGLKVWMERRTATRELMALDDRMLRDIGISRSDIPEIVATFGRIAPESDVSNADPLESLRQWARRRATAKDLSSLDNRTLNDIGMVRGDIDWVAEELAFRSLRPANSNHATRIA